MNLKAYAGCGVILTAWSIALGILMQNNSWLYGTGLFALVALLVVCWLCWILTPLNLGSWKTNLGE
jgi:hypothetical protein